MKYILSKLAQGERFEDEAYSSKYNAVGALLKYRDIQSELERR